MPRDVEEIQADLKAAKDKQHRLQDEALTLIERSSTGRLSSGEEERLDRIQRGVGRAADEIANLDDEWRTAMRSEIRRNARYATEPGDGAVQRVHGHPEFGYGRPRNVREDGDVISRAMRVLERDGRHLASESQDRVDTLLRTEPSERYQPRYIAERLIVTENPVYRSAFMNYLSAVQNNRPVILTGEESDALRAYDAFERSWDISRAMGEVTTTAGGFGIPSLVDPSIIVTSGAADVPLLRYCRIEDVTVNVWKGVSSEGASWSYDTEAAEVSDDSPTLAQPSVTVHMARGFIPYSIEVGQDYPNFINEIGRLLDQGYSDLLASKLMTGSGTGEPWGIFTAIDQTSASEVTPTTDGAFGGVDIFKVWNALPERARPRAIWVMSTSVASAIRQFSAAAGSASAYFTVDLQGASFVINERPVITTDYAPTFSGAVPGTTGAQNILVVGDPSAYVFARRAGMQIEAVPHIFHTSNNRPSGQRGIFAWSRNGGDSVADNLWRLLQNQ